MGSAVTAPEGAVPSSDLGHRLKRERERRFFGREAELELLAAALDTPDGSAFGVLWVHGPGGVGKSTLLGAYADLAHATGCRVLRPPARSDGTTRATLWSLLAPSARAAGRSDPVDQRRVVIIDGAEGLGADEDWLRTELIPALPETTVVVIAGRRPPDERWLADPGWRPLLRVISLRNLEAGSVRALLAVEGLPTGSLDRVMALTHGHPLAVSLLVEAVHRDGVPRLPESLGELPDVVSALLHRAVEEAPSAAHRIALQTCAHAPVTTESALRVTLPDASAAVVSQLWEWLRDLAFVEDSAAGLRPHGIARDVIDADLRRRDPDGYAAIHRRLRAHVVEQVRRVAGNPAALQHAVGDLLFLSRDHPLGGLGWDWDAFAQPPGEPVETADLPDLIALTELLQGAEQARLAVLWFRRQPRAFRLFRDGNGNVRGFVARLALHLASLDDISSDPGTAAAWRYAREHIGPRPGEQVLVWRFLVDRDVDERHPRSTGTLFGAWHISDILLRSPTAWEFISCYADLEHWLPFYRHWDFAHLPDSDFHVGSRRYRTFGHDWRRVGVADWLDRTAARELGEDVASEPVPSATALSHEEFADAVKQALRDLHQPAALLRNPLLASGMLQHRLREHPDSRPDQILRTLILDATTVLKGDPRAAIQYRVLDRTYLRPAPSQEKAAELLDLPFTTYRRHRNRGIETISEWLWELDIDAGASSPASRVG